VTLLELVLICSLAFFVLCQIFNGIVNLCTARYMRKKSELQEKIREDEARSHYEQSERMIMRFNHISDRLNEAEDIATFRFEEIMQALEEMPQQPIGIKKRGKYKPRKPKAIEHKEIQ